MAALASGCDRVDIAPGFVTLGDMAISNGNSFNGESAYPEMWLFRLMQPVQDRDGT
jgi:hypothetical protein